MSVGYHMRFWLFGLAAFLLLVWLLSDILLPFVLGLASAYLLDPVCDWLERRGLSRSASNWVITTAFIVLLLLSVLLVLPAVAGQVADLAKRLPELVDMVSRTAERLLEGVAAGGEPMAQARTALGESLGSAASVLGAAIGGVIAGGAALISWLGLLFLTPIVTFFLLRDWDRIVGKIDSWLPRAQAPLIRDLARQVDDILAGYVRGVLTVCLVLALLYATALTLAGLQFGLVIGIVAGLLSVVPYLGAIVGFLLAVGFALLQFSEWLPILTVAAIFLVGQVIEGNFLTPKLVGDRIGLHPVLVILAVLTGGTLFGLTGALLALPAAAVIGVGSRFALEKYLDSPLYRG